MPETTTFTDLLKQQFPQWVLGAHRYRGDETVLIKREGLLEICRFLRDDPRAAFNFLMDLGGADYQGFGQAAAIKPSMTTPSPLPYFMRPKAVAETWDRLVDDEYRFEVVYHLYSITQNRRLRLKVPLTEADPVVDSVATVWRSANWFEREVWDMFGVRFTGHPNLKRLLMYEPFDGHPLRKDYPVTKRQPLIGPAN